ncbi:MAG: hypothetical protein ABSC16_01310 [Candidatus Dormibacteria bacterium]
MRRRRLGVLSWAVVLLVAAATGVWGGVASAGGDCAGNCVLGVLELTGPPPVLNPTVGAGTTSSLTFTVTNDTAGATSEGSAGKGPLLVESAELTAPAGFAIQSATLVAPRKHDPPTAHVSIDTATTPYTYTVDLDDLDLAPGASISAVLSVTASCAATSGTWALSVQPAPTAHGQGFTVDPSSALSVGVTGACTLAFTADPTNAVIGQDITHQGFDPSGSPVEVEARAANGRPVAGVEVTLSAEVGSGTLSGTTSSTTGGPDAGTLGVAAFSPLSIGQTGYYSLQAGAPAFVTADSSLFQITDGATPCTGSCSGSASNDTVSAAVSVSNPGTGDTLSVALSGFSYQCPDWLSPTGYYPTVTTPLGVDLWQSDGSLDPSPRSVQVALTIPGSAPPPPFFPFYQVCYASTEPFSGGTLVGAAQSIPGYAGSTYVGLLPYCPVAATAADAPCVLSSSWGDGSAVVTFVGAPGDFWGSA